MKYPDDVVLFYIHEVTFKWHDEPGEYVWTINRDLEQKHKVKISITNCVKVQSNSKPKLETIKFDVKLKLFSLCILKQMEKIRDLMIEKSFKENREGEFLFDELKEYEKAYLNAYS